MGSRRRWTRHPRRRARSSYNRGHSRRRARLPPRPRPARSGDGGDGGAFARPRRALRPARARLADVVVVVVVIPRPRGGRRARARAPRVPARRRAETRARGTARRGGRPRTPARALLDRSPPPLRRARPRRARGDLRGGARHAVRRGGAPRQGELRRPPRGDGHLRLQGATRDDRRPRDRPRDPTSSARERARALPPPNCSSVPPPEPPTLSIYPLRVPLPRERSSLK